jgi:hypothetical protein
MGRNRSDIEVAFPINTHVEPWFCVARGAEMVLRPDEHCIGSARLNSSQ